MLRPRLNVDGVAAVVAVAGAFRCGHRAAKQTAGEEMGQAAAVPSAATSSGCDDRRTAEWMDGVGMVLTSALATRCKWSGSRRSWSGDFVAEWRTAIAGWDADAGADAYRRDGGAEGGGGGVG